MNFESSKNNKVPYSSTNVHVAATPRRRHDLDLLHWQQKKSLHLARTRRIARSPPHDLTCFREEEVGKCASCPSLTSEDFSVGTVEGASIFRVEY